MAMSPKNLTSRVLLYDVTKEKAQLLATMKPGPPIWWPCFLRTKLFSNFAETDQRTDQQTGQKQYVTHYNLNKSHEISRINVTSRVLTSFFLNFTNFKLGNDINVTNVKTKFHEDWTINVASRAVLDVKRRTVD
ncbi:hypothetical protein DPMN_013828 [Dreissena polymorpha]|uniref:Uncharacterized protein n=1 Tax=Dreissena polymorpha TaxID=45954 RepID=A0A9D4N8L3_DREPO|nr:hypothetical protein DPMN_013828 [Dreissena polymorpha]